MQWLQGAQDRHDQHWVTSAAQQRAVEALARLDAITRRLRAECPWDREQDERSIVPHTVEEAYELADAAGRGDDAKLLDELGDVLFQVHFLALLLEERQAGSLADVADHEREKLIRRHPHVFGSAQARSPSGEGRPEADRRHQDAEPEAPRSTPLSAAAVLRNWDVIKQQEPGREPGLFGEVPETLPALLYARKVQRRAASHGHEGEPLSVRDALGELEAASDADARFEALGELLFAVVDVARRTRVDPELALRAASDRFRQRVLGASSEDRSWKDPQP